MRVDHASAVKKGIIKSLWVDLLYLASMKFFIWFINSGVLTSLLLPHLSPSLIDSLPSLNLLCHSKTDAQSIQDGRMVSVAFFPSLKHNFIVYRSSKVSSRPDCIFEVHKLKFVPRVLREDQKERRCHDSREMVELINSDPAIFDALVTCDEI